MYVESIDIAVNLTLWRNGSAEFHSLEVSGFQVLFFAVVAHR